MSKVAKIFVIVILVFAIIYVGLNASLLAKQEHWKYQFNKEKQAKIKMKEELDAKVTAAEEKRDTYKSAMNRALEDKDKADTLLNKQVTINTNLEKKWDTLNANYTSLEQRYNTLAEELKSSRNEIKSLHTQLTEAKDSLDAALKRRDQAQDDLARVQKAEGDLKLVLNDLKKRHVGLAMENEQLKFLVARVQEQTGLPIAKLAGRGLPAISGAVAGVSNKHNLVVINVGEDDGVHVGFEFTIFRGKEYVAKMVIEKVYPNQAAGRIIPMTQKDKVLVGDKVATKVY